MYAFLPLKPDFSFLSHIKLHMFLKRMSKTVYFFINTFRATIDEGNVVLGINGLRDAPWSSVPDSVSALDSMVLLLILCLG